MLPLSEAYLEPSQTSQMEFSLKAVNSFHKKIHLRYLGSEQASDY